MITEDPFHIMLRFQPSALENIDEKEKEMNQFYTASRENQCVVCGAKQNYMKYNVSALFQFKDSTCNLQEIFAKWVQIS